MRWLIVFSLSVALFAGSAPPARATVVYSAQGITVTGINAYSEYGGGDIAFTVSSPPTGCDGLWLRPSDAGFKTLSALVMMLYTTKQPLQLGAIDDSLWSGSNGRFCRVWGIYPS